MAAATTTTDNTKDLTGFKALSFDCYGTLINWEAGLAAALQEPIVSKLPASHPYRAKPSEALQHFNRLSEALEQAQPSLRYDELLAETAQQLAAELSLPRLDEAAAAAIGSAPGSWAPFADTVEALGALARRYKLIILSNIDKGNIGRTVAGPLGGGPFSAVYTAEAIGSYKPALRNFHYLFAHSNAALGVYVERGDLLHVARSLTADHVPAAELGLPSVWISRGGDRPEGYGVGGDYEALRARGKVAFEWKFDTLGDFAREVERQFGEKEG